jgi:bifunctional DNase/RNase
MRYLWVIFALLLAIGAAGPADAAEGGGKLYEMEVLGVQPDSQSGTPMVFLRGRQDKRELVMFIGRAEAQGIVMPLQGARPPRPQTHDLLLEVIRRLRAKVLRVVITEMRESTYFANLVLEVGGQELIVDARPSDAIAVALRAEAPILAAEAAFARSAKPGSGAGEQETP